MPETSTNSSSMRLRTGSKISLLAAIPFLALAAYFFWAPITIQSPNNGQIYNCGSAASGAESTFQRNVCGDLPDTNTVRALASLATGLLIAIGGVALFGVDGSRPRPRFDEDDDLADDEPDDEDDRFDRPAPAHTSERGRAGGRRSYEKRSTTRETDLSDDEPARNRASRRADASAPSPRREAPPSDWDGDWDGDDDRRRR